MKILVVYFSRTGNTKGLGEAIAAQLGADTVEIKESAKRSGFFGYLQSGREAAFKKVTVINSDDSDLGQFDLVIVGTPIWCWSLSSPVRAYLMENASRLDNVAFFCTEGGSGGANAFKEMAAQCAKQPVATLEVTEADIKDGTDKEKLNVFIQAVAQFATEPMAKSA